MTKVATNEHGDAWCDGCGERLLLPGYAGGPSIERPMVMVTVEGGIASTEVIRGDVEIVQWDWDGIDDTSEPSEILDYIEQAERLPDDWWAKAGILATMREALEDLGYEDGE